MGYIDDSEINPYAAPKEESVPLYSVGRFTGYAGFWVRVGAFLIDSIILFVISFPAGFILGLVMAATGSDQMALSLLSNAFGLIVNLTYFGLMTSSGTQATLGKMAMGIKVTDLQGRRISLGRALIRELAKILSALLLLIGYIMVAFTERKQGLHDMIAGTLVVKTR